jgi:hypothetical protein
MFTTDKTIAEKLGISRQAVAKHRRRGMPADLDAAVHWYSTNVSYSRRKGQPPYFSTEDAGHAVRLTTLDDLEETVTLDDYPPGFWGEDASVSITSIVMAEHDSPATAADILALWSCVNAAMLRHLHDLSKRMGEQLGRRAEDMLYQWTELFCARWFGDDFREQPMLTKSARELTDFYRPIKTLPGQEGSRWPRAEVPEPDRCVSTSNPSAPEVA